MTTPENRRESSAAKVDLAALRVQTEERLAQSKRSRDKTREARLWDDYRRTCNYYEAVLALIESHDAVLGTGVMLDV